MGYPDWVECLKMVLTCIPRLIDNAEALSQLSQHTSVIYQQKISLSYQVTCRGHYSRGRAVSRGCADMGGRSDLIMRIQLRGNPPDPSCLLFVNIAGKHKDHMPGWGPLEGPECQEGLQHCQQIQFI